MAGRAGSGALHDEPAGRPPSRGGLAGVPGQVVLARLSISIAGLATVGRAVSAAVLLVTSYVASGLTAAVISVLVFLVFGLLWFALPLTRR